MAHIHPLSTQRDLIRGFAAELGAAGFADAVEIGSGGFGVVYRCAQPALDRIVAVKVLTADLDSENTERFVREQLAMGKLCGHPNIVSVFEIGSTPTGRPYIVMQHHPHGSLEARVHNFGPLGWQDTLHIGVKIAGALETAHRRGMLHRDVKPGNILLDEYGEPQLTDFGIARLTGGFVTTAGTVAGSPAFTAPEVLQGHPPDPTADVYGLAATLFCAATGHAVFERRSGEQLVAQFLRITKLPTPDLGGAGLPEDMTTAIERAMSRDRRDRPTSAAEFGQALREIQVRHGLAPTELPVPHPVSEPVIAHSAPTPGGPERRSTADLLATQPTRTPPVPATRFRPPPPTPTLVDRVRLLDTLRRGRERRLAVLHGPTGFGKSTVAAQWFRELTAEGVAVAWLTVDDDDNTVIWFLSHLIEAVRVVRPALARELGAVLEEHGDEAERYVLTSLINDIDRRGEELVVIIDDWHRIGSDATVAALRYLVESCSPAVHVVVTSRSRTGLPMSSMRARDELVEIDATALRFDAEEAHTFLVGRTGLPLDDDDVAELTESTEGWIAALQLAALTLRESESPEELIGQLTGRHHVIGEFLAENVLATLEPELLDFLLATSITERLCGDLASALAGVADGQAVLERIERRDLFLRRLDDEHWFRYQHLFAEFLRQRLEREQPERIAGLHRTAARWFADHHDVSEAVDHALRAGDDAHAVEVVERDGMSLLEHGQAATLLGLVGKLPAPVVESRPRLQLTLAWADILLNRIERGGRALRLAESLLRAETADTTILRVEAAAARGVVSLRADVLAGIDDLLAPCFAHADELPPYVVGIAANVAVYAAAYRYDMAEALRRYEWAAPYLRRNTGSYNEINALCFLGIAANLRMDVPQAEQYFRKALKLAKHSGFSHSYAGRLAGALLGELLYERGEVAAAERLLDAGYTLGPEAGIVDFKLARYVVGARIKALRGDRSAAVRRLNEGARVARAMSLPRLRIEIENERLRLGLPPHPEYGPLPVLDYADRRIPLDAADEFTVLSEEFTAIRLLLAEHRPERTALACTWAQEWVDLLEMVDRPRELLEARRLFIACLTAAGRTAQAKAVAAGVAARCAEFGLVRYLLDGGPDVVRTLAALRADRLSGRWRPEWPDVPEDFLAALVEADAVRAV
ncbi:serine/threonine-protein kinase [Nocardia terpenica]|uniref:Serine/threonine-protein kinase PknK n=1 Tax=Nocardia terpenica TaxID=455432 RepID=A0A161XB20_9NOCA|nr:serine/threonine-protein kinase [Nocardia terpenica]KZM70348.1 protein kinase [Nocardia terpenica]NQE91022.1 protein kinase [Nocardia terpenica]